MRHILLCVSLILPLAACQQIMQEEHLPRATMQNVLMDLHLAEVYSTLAGRDSLHTGGAKNLDSLAVYYNEVFAHHKINKDEFVKSISWYRSHPDELDSAYARMIPAMEKIR